MIIAVTGTPGTGKTELAKKIAKKLKLKYLDVNKVIEENRLADSYDKKKKCKVVDVKKLNKVLIKLMKDSKDLVIDSHLSHFLPKKYVDLCVVAKCDLKLLKKRLEKRGYSKEKIRENMDAEIFDVCLVEASEGGHRIKVIDTTKGINLDNFI